MQDLSYPLTLPEFAEQVAGRSADLIRTRVREGQIQCHRIGMRLVQLVRVHARSVKRPASRSQRAAIPGCAAG